MSEKNIILTIVLLFILGAFCIGIYKQIQYLNGNTPSQIEARKKMEEASERASKAMSEHMQWYKEQMDEFKHPAETLESVRK